MNVDKKTNQLKKMPVMKKPTTKSINRQFIQTLMSFSRLFAWH